MRFLIFALITASSLGRAHAQSPPRKVAIVVVKRDDFADRLNARVSQQLAGRAEVSVEQLSAIDLGNPIERGKLISLLDTRDLVVPVGDEATAFVSREVEGSRVYFVGVGVVSGDWLASRVTAGIFSFNVDRLLDAVEQLPMRSLGFAYTPGYEPVAEWVRRGARERGIPLREKRIEDVKELPSALRDLLDHVRVVWIAGDPKLAEGAGFEFLAERALSRRLPLISTGSGDLQRGAFMAFEAAEAPLAARASQEIGLMLGGAVVPKLQPVPDGVVLVNRVLSKKWGIPAPAGIPMRLVP